MKTRSGDHPDVLRYNARNEQNAFCPFVRTVHPSFSNATFLLPMLIIGSMQMHIPLRNNGPHPRLP